MKETVYLDGKDVDVLPWEAIVSASDAALARFTRQLVLMKGWFTSSSTGGYTRPGSRADWQFIIYVPVGYEQRFCDAVKCELRAPTQPIIGNQPRPPADPRRPIKRFYER